MVSAPFPRTDSALTQAWRNHALAALGYSLARPGLHRAVNHQAHSIKRALAELRARGDRRIGLVIRRDEDQLTERNWLSSVLLARHDAAGSELSYPLLLAEKIERRALLAGVKRERPEVVMTTEPEVGPMLSRGRAERVGWVLRTCTSRRMRWVAAASTKTKSGWARRRWISWWSSCTDTRLGCRGIRRRYSSKAGGWRVRWCPGTGRGR